MVKLTSKECHCIDKAGNVAANVQARPILSHIERIKEKEERGRREGTVTQTISTSTALKTN